MKSSVGQSGNVPLVSVPPVSVPPVSVPPVSVPPVSVFVSDNSLTVHSYLSVSDNPSGSDTSDVFTDKILLGIGWAVLYSIVTVPVAGPLSGASSTSIAFDVKSDIIPPVSVTFTVHVMFLPTSPSSTV